MKSPINTALLDKFQICDSIVSNGVYRLPDSSKAKMSVAKLSLLPD